MTEVTKICSDCKIPKPLSAFSNNFRYKDNKRPDCKKCNSERTKRNAKKRKQDGDFLNIFL
jgi:transposase-like protein